MGPAAGPDHVRSGADQLKRLHLFLHLTLLSVSSRVRKSPASPDTSKSRTGADEAPVSVWAAPRHARLVSLASLTRMAANETGHLVFEQAPQTLKGFGQVVRGDPIDFVSQDAHCLGEELLMVLSSPCGHQGADFGGVIGHEGPPAGFPIERQSDALPKRLVRVRRFSRVKRLTSPRIRGQERPTMSAISSTVLGTLAQAFTMAWSVSAVMRGLGFHPVGRDLNRGPS